MNSPYSLCSAAALECTETLSPSSLDSTEMTSDLDNSELAYAKSLETSQRVFNPYLVHVFQPDLSRLMYLQLIQWISQVCQEFSLKSETFYLAIIQTTRFFATEINVKKEELQLVGVAAISLACKVEEVLPLKGEQLSCSSGFTYSVPRITAMELRLLKALNWKVYTVTPYNWLCFAMKEWDEFVEDHWLAENSSSGFGDGQDPLFLQETQASYGCFRKAVALLDSLYFSIDSYSYSFKEIALSVLYVVAVTHCLDSKALQAAHRESLGSCLNSTVNNFLSRNFGVVLEDLSEEIRTCLENYSVLEVNPDLQLDKSNFWRTGCALNYKDFLFSHIYYHKAVLAALKHL